MQQAFPELQLVRGHYYCSGWGERTHWWLVAADGSVVDPTAVQFPSKGKGVYVQLDEDQPEPTGMCPQCGEYTYDNEYIHEGCAAAYAAYCLHG